MKRELINLILGIIAWGLIAFAILIIILKLFKLIGSPPVTEILLSGILLELIRIETKFKEFSIKTSMLWLNFKKRKEF